MVELQRHRIRVATRLSLCRDWVVCITATLSRPNNFQLRTELLRCQDRREIHARILTVEPLPRASGTPRAVDDHAMQSAAFQGGASCIKDSAAFSFDEPHRLMQVFSGSCVALFPIAASICFCVRPLAFSEVRPSEVRPAKDIC